MNLSKPFLQHPITNDTELIAIQAWINSLLDKAALTQDDRDYLKILGMLVYEYEEEHEPMPTLKGINLLKALMEESSLQPQDLVPIFESEAMVAEILNSERPLTETQIFQLANLFHISPASF
jgi:HTH-type transcriptional regulator / antitoxin HigA